MARGNDINEYHLYRNQPGKPQLAMYDLNDYLQKDKINTARPHIHSFYQVIWFKSGRGRHFVDFNQYKVFPDTIFFIAKNQVHSFDNHRHYQGILIHFNELFLDQTTDALLKDSLFNNLRQQPSCRITKELTLALDECILQIKRELKNEDRWGAAQLLRNHLQSFLMQIQRGIYETEKAQNNISSAPDKKRIPLFKFVNLIEQNYNKGLTTREYAALLFMSPRTLSDLTHRLLNKTPSRLIQERIVLEAQRLLVHSNLNINQISYRLGFDDPSYFVKFFRKHAGKSPSAFRKSVS